MMETLGQAIQDVASLASEAGYHVEIDHDQPRIYIARSSRPPVAFHGVRAQRELMEVSASAAQFGVSSEQYFMYMTHSWYV